MSIVINDCPFCGWADVEIGEEGIYEFAVDCPNCRAIGPIAATVMEAIHRWNTRRPLPEKEFVYSLERSDTGPQVALAVP